MLKRNANLNGLGDTIFCERVAVSDQAGKINIFLNHVQGGISNQATSSSVLVTVVTLSSLMEKYKIDNVNILQIDVEGAEIPVLKGFPWGKRGIGKVYRELHPYAWPEFDYTVANVQRILSERGLRCFDMYLEERMTFDDSAYIGPAVLIAQPKPN